MPPGIRPDVVTDLTGAVHRPLRLSERFRTGMVDRIALHGPIGLSPSELIDSRRRIQNLPLDVLYCLELLAMMADRGNRLAVKILVSEREKFGIDRPRHFGT